MNTLSDKRVTNILLQWNADKVMEILNRAITSPAGICPISRTGEAMLSVGICFRLLAKLPFADLLQQLKTETDTDTLRKGMSSILLQEPSGSGNVIEVASEVLCEAPFPRYVASICLHVIMTMDSTDILPMRETIQRYIITGKHHLDNIALIELARKVFTNEDMMLIGKNLLTSTDKHRRLIGDTLLYFSDRDYITVDELEAQKSLPKKIENLIRKILKY